MPRVILPDVRFHQPDLLYRARKPVGQVKIDWGHPISRGLRFADIFNGQNDLTKFRTLLNSSVVRNADRIEFNGSGSHLDYGTQSGGLDSQERFTVTAKVRLDNTTSDHSIVEKTDPDFSSGWTLFFDVTGGPVGADQFDFFVKDGPNNDRASSAANKTAGIYTVSCDFDVRRASGSRTSMSIDGLDETLGVSTGGVPTVSGNNDSLFIGQHSSSSSRRYWESDMYFVYIHNRILNSSEKMSLHLNPYELLIPNTSSGRYDPSIIQFDTSAAPEVFRRRVILS